MHGPYRRIVVPDLSEFSTLSHFASDSIDDPVILTTGRLRYVDGIATRHRIQLIDSRNLQQWRSSTTSRSRRTTSTRTGEQSLDPFL